MSYHPVLQKHLSLVDMFSSPCSVWSEVRPWPVTDPLVFWSVGWKCHPLLQLGCWQQWIWQTEFILFKSLWIFFLPHCFMKVNEKSFGQSQRNKPRPSHCVYECIWERVWLRKKLAKGTLMQKTVKQWSCSRASLSADVVLWLLLSWLGLD